MPKARLAAINDSRDGIGQLGRGRTVDRSRTGCPAQTMRFQDCGADLAGSRMGASRSRTCGTPVAAARAGVTSRKADSYTWSRSRLRATALGCVARPVLPHAHRYEWLIQLAESLHSLHESGALSHGLRPDIVAVTPTGQAVITDLRDMLPMPVPRGVAASATFYTAPELLLSPELADPRADLYGFGGLLYALTIGRDITRTTSHEGLPRQFLHRSRCASAAGKDRQQDVFARPDLRFPSDPATPRRHRGIDPSLDAYRRNMGRLA